MSKEERSLLQAVEHYAKKDVQRILQAIEVCKQAHGHQIRADGSPYSDHPIAVATILAEWHGDADTLIAGLLHDTLEDTDLSSEQIASKFGESVADLVEGVTKFTVADVEHDHRLDRKTETLRKMFETMRRDIRVAIIKLADRLHNVRTIDSLSEERQKRFAQETIDIYYKLAERLGINDVRRELGDRCMPILKPKEIQGLQRRLTTLKRERNQILRSMQRKINQSEHGKKLIDLQAHVNSYYTLLAKQTFEKGDEFPWVYIIIVKDQEDCYTLLQLIHSLYRPISKRFRDYIAAPRESSYQTLQTTVVGPHEHLLPIRIRTEEMNRQEQKGILLKAFEGKNLPGFSWLKQSERLDLSTKKSSKAFLQAIKSDIFHEKISVTIDGEGASMPYNSTVLDVVYTHYEKRANRTDSILVNGKEARLSQSIVEDDVIQVTFTREHHVNYEWLRYVETQYARALIVEALKERGRDEKYRLGSRLLQDELDFFHKGLLSNVSYGRTHAAAQYYQREDFEEVIIMIGEGIVTAQSVFFQLFPEQASVKQSEQAKDYAFRIRVVAHHSKLQEGLAELLHLSLGHNTTMYQANIHKKKKDTIHFFLEGSCESRLHYANLIEDFQKQPWIESVETLVSPQQKFFFFSLFSLACFTTGFSAFFLTQYASQLSRIAFLPSIFIQVVPLLPIFIFNFYLLHMLRTYVLRMRNDRWFLGSGFAINIVGLLMVMWQKTTLPGAHASFFPLVALFVLSLFSLGYFFQKSQNMLEAPAKKKPLNAVQWKELRRKKMIGYALRFFAVVIWGIDPLYNKYVFGEALHPFILLILTSIGVIGVTLIAMFTLWLRALMQRKESISNTTKTYLSSLKIPYNKGLFSIVLGMASFRFLLIVSLSFTTSTNFILFNNFSPVFALLVAVLLWRNSIPYLKEARHMLWVFVVFLVGSTGSALVLYSSLQNTSGGSIHGDLLGLVAMTMDTFLVISQIRYMKNHNKASSLSISAHVFTFLILSTLPILLYIYAIRPELIVAVPWSTIIAGLGAGALLGIGQIFNYEAFRRVDGFIAFLMFNVSILVTFSIEVFVLKTFNPSLLMILGGITIVASTVIAEMINGHCEKKGL